MPKPLSRDAKEMIASLVDYFTRERDNKGPLLPIICVQERTANALNVSMRTVSNVTREIRENDCVRGPKMHRPRKRTVRDISPTQAQVIRECLHQMIENKQNITIVALHAYLQERKLFEGSIRSLGRILHDLGFNFNTKDPCSNLMELSHFTDTDVKFLKE